MQAQNKEIDTNKDSLVNATKILQGVLVQVDAASLVQTALGANASYSMEGAVLFDVMHKYFPVLEVGYAGADQISINDISFHTNSVFGRAGVDFNLSKPKKNSKPTNNLLLGGLRLGMSNFNYSVKNVVINDDYWGGTISSDYSSNKTSKIWFEIVFSIRVEVVKNVFMGWSVRNKNLIGEDVAGKLYPWYIPGFGINKSTNWGLNYMLGYRF